MQDAEIVDLGGGTGNFTQALAEAAGCRRRVLCVDAFAEMLQKVRLQGRCCHWAQAVHMMLGCTPSCSTYHANHVRFVHIPTSAGSQPACLALPVFV